MAQSMKKYYLSSAILLVVLASVSVSAQRPAAQPTPMPRPTTSPTTAAPAPSNVTLPTSKMAVIYTEAFLDAKGGIQKFGTVITKLNAEFQKQKDDLNQLQQRAQQLESEVNRLQNAPAGTPIDTKSITTKVDQLEQLKKDIQRKAEDAQSAYNRRQGELFAPLQEEIGRALEVFAKARNINVIIDATRVPLMYAAASTDITRAFINEFNAKNPVTASTTPPQ
jgi:Skp family chaperone for outer membrane proteins